MPAGAVATGFGSPLLHARLWRPRNATAVPTPPARNARRLMPGRAGLVGAASFPSRCITHLRAVRTRLRLAGAGPRENR